MYVLHDNEITFQTRHRDLYHLNCHGVAQGMGPII